MSEAYTAAKAQALEAELLATAGAHLNPNVRIVGLLSRAATMIQTQRLLLEGADREVVAELLFQIEDEALIEGGSFTVTQLVDEDADRDHLESPAAPFTDQPKATRELFLGRADRVLALLAGDSTPQPSAPATPCEGREAMEVSSGE